MNKSIIKESCTMDYNNILIDIKGINTKIDEVIQLFKERTGEDYKSFLVDKYINQNISKPNLAEMLGITVGQMEVHLKKLDIKKPKRKKSNNKYSKSVADIEKETNRRFMDILNELTDQGLSHTEIAQQLHLKNISDITLYINNEKAITLLKNLDESKLVIKETKGQDYRKIEKLFRDKLNIEYKDFLYQKYIVEGMNILGLIELLGISKQAIRNRLQAYGITKTLSQARQDAINRGDIDYTNINAKARKTKNKLGNNNRQEILRDLIRYYLEIHINKLNENIEAVIGFNEWGILKNKEVDIPIIIINNNKFYKFSVEYNPYIWHTETNKDDLKESKLKENEWIHYIVYEEAHKSPSLHYIEEESKKVVNKIIEYINQ